MRKVEKLKKSINNYLFDHYNLKKCLEYVVSFGFSILGSAAFAFGFCCFINAPAGQFTLVTGGASGVSQVIALVIRMIFNFDPPNNIVYSVTYFVINIPLLIFAFLKISKKFAIFSTISALLSSIFCSLFTTFSEPIMTSSILDGNVLARVIFAGICTGISSAICFKGDISCGGIDIITYYIGMKKSSTIGKYSVIINCFVIAAFAVCKIIEIPGDYSNAVFIVFFSTIYLLVCGLIIDYINSRNKKVELQIITTNPKMSLILLAYFPHGATINSATGAYTHNEKFIIWMVVSTNEVKKAINVAKKVDEHVFISSIPLRQVYGNFYSKPID